MGQPFLALITPLGGGQVDNSLPGNQPIAGWGPGFPTNPIAPGGGGGGGVVPPPIAGIPIFPGNLPVIPGQGGGGGSGGTPDQSLPGAQPGIGTLPSGSFILVWSPINGWILIGQGGQPPVSQGPGGSVDNTLPGQQPIAGQPLPGDQPSAGQPLPGNQPEAGQDLPPHKQPKK